jgi:hypothetical protein
VAQPRGQYQHQQPPYPPHHRRDYH